MGTTRIRTGLKTLLESAGGSEKGKPHSSKEGRIAAGKRGIKRFLESRRQPLLPTKGKMGVKPKWKSMPWKPGQNSKMQPLNSGGKATRGYGKAYMKGGRAK